MYHGPNVVEIRDTRYGNFANLTHRPANLYFTLRARYRYEKKIAVKVDKSRRKGISRSCIVIQRHLLPSARRWCENIKRTCERAVETVESNCYERGNKVRRGVVPNFGFRDRKRIDSERYRNASKSVISWVRGNRGTDDKRAFQYLSRDLSSRVSTENRIRVDRKESLCVLFKEDGATNNHRSHTIVVIFAASPVKSPSGIKTREARKIVPSDSFTRCLRTLSRTKETRCSCTLWRLRITTSLVMEDLTISRAIFTRQRCTVYRCQGHGTTRTAAHSLSALRRRPSSSSRYRSVPLPRTFPFLNLNKHDISLAWSRWSRYFLHLSR